jgi:dolichol-phosphate mannosyltransferase
MKEASMPKKLLSVVLPSYNEEKNVPLAYEEIVKNIDASKYDYEIIFVNDGSKDNTWGVITELAAKDPHVKGLCFSRNFGHPAALQAGLEEAKGDAVIMMDADLQHPPTLIPKLVEEWEGGYDIVNTVRKSTEKIGLVKRITAKGFYKVMNGISDLKLNEGEADFRLIDRKALNTLNEMPESPKFYRGLVNWVGFKVKRVDYKAVARRHGTSSFTMKKMFELARLGLTSFSMKPLKLIITVGLTLSGASLVGLIAMFAIKLFVNPLYVSYGSILVMFLIFITGLLATFQGIVAIYLVDIFNVSKGRPTFIVGERAGHGKK